MFAGSAWREPKKALMLSVTFDDSHVPELFQDNRMAVRKITEYPESVLAQVGKPVTEFNKELEDLCADMFDTMYEAEGVGLAAPQISLSLRLFVMDRCCSEARPIARGIVAVGGTTVLRAIGVRRHLPQSHESFIDSPNNYRFYNSDLWAGNAQDAGHYRLWQQS